MFATHIIVRSKRIVVEKNQFISNIHENRDETNTDDYPQHRGMVCVTKEQRNLG